jgi:hypothetical protein
VSAVAIFLEINFAIACIRLIGQKSHLLGPLFLGNENNVGRIEPMEVIGVKIGELVENHHDIYLDGVPASLEESSREAI